MADSDSSDAARRRQLRHASPKNYDVGYARPPAATRFQPGQSGNPKGRPKGSKNKLPALQEERLKSIVLEEAYRTIKIRDGDKNVSVSMATAIVRTLAVNAAKGNNRAALLFSNLLQTTERENRELHNAWLDTALTYKIEWDKELARRKRLGIIADDPIPHPDDIVINPRTGKVSVLGPMTREEKQVWDAAAELKEDLARAVEVSERKLSRTTDPEWRHLLTAQIEQDREYITRIEQLIPSRKALDWLSAKIGYAPIK